MNRDLHNFRASYERGELLIENTAASPFEQFSTWFAQAEQEATIKEPNTMSLATLGLDGFTKARIVLLKEFTEEGFIFYTNYNSEKGKSIAVNPQVGLSFFWPPLERQVIIKGNATKVPSETSDAYFNKRPKDSQLGAIVSNQSETTTREALENTMETLKAKYKERTIPRPDHWGGYIVAPVSVEFWQGRPSRLHDRILYRKKKGIWMKERLAP